MCPAGPIAHFSLPLVDLFPSSFHHLQGGARTHNCVSGAHGPTTVRGPGRPQTTHSVEGQRPYPGPHQARTQVGQPFSYTTLPLLQSWLPGSQPGGQCCDFSPGRMHIFQNGSLVIHDVAPEDSGRYTCIAGNSCNIKHTEAPLYVVGMD